jgi:ABC-type bacteriocin/lantibiotic exporter with double-glycine peptidase domain
MVRELPIVVGMLLSFGCTSGQGAPSPAAPSSHVIQGVPFAAYRSDLCGPAALAAVLQFYGENVTAAEIAKDIYLPNYHGTLNLDLLLYARARGFDVWAGEGSAERMKQALAQDRPVICMVRESGRIADRNHFVVIRGYDSVRRIWLSDDGDGRETPRKMDGFERRWRECSHWMLVVNRKKTPSLARE